jgi:sugar phosphate isomerase/epimerase
MVEKVTPVGNASYRSDKNPCGPRPGAQEAPSQTRPNHAIRADKVTYLSKKLGLSARRGSTNGQSFRYTSDAKLRALLHMPLSSSLRFCLVLILSLLAPLGWSSPPVAQSPGQLAAETGLQLWSLRSLLTREATPAEISEALGRVAQWGFTHVETAGTGALTAAEFRTLLDFHGLRVVSMHTNYASLRDNLAEVIAQAHALGTTHVVCPSIPRQQGIFDDAAARRAAAAFNDWGKALRAAGLRFAYHLHGYEFAPSQENPADYVLDTLIRATDPALVEYQMDVFWVYHAKADPVALLEKYPDRWSMLHVKDLRRGAPRAGDAGVTAGRAPAGDKVAVGTGPIDWAAVYAAASRVGVRHAFIEDEGEEPLAAIPRSLRYVRALAPHDDATWQPVADADGWIALDGAAAWRTYNDPAHPTRWQFDEGLIGWRPRGGDLVTRGEFANFELELEWRVSPGGNSGIMWHVREAPGRAAPATGPEMQILDDSRHRDGGDPLTSAGSLYGLYAPSGPAARPVGEWNQVRIVVRGPHVQLSLNGHEVVSAEVGSADWQRRIATSKFATWRDFARYPSGRIVLQDHGDPVWFRHVRIRSLP